MDEQLEREAILLTAALIGVFGLMALLYRFMPATRPFLDAIPPWTGAVAAVLLVLGQEWRAKKKKGEE